MFGQTIKRPPYFLGEYVMEFMASAVRQEMVNTTARNSIGEVERFRGWQNGKMFYGNVKTKKLYLY